MEETIYFGDHSYSDTLCSPSKDDQDYIDSWFDEHTSKERYNWLRDQEIM